VRAEATLADRNGTLVPVIIEPCERPIIFELTHSPDFSHWDGDRSDAAWQAYLKDVRRTVKRSAGAEEAASPQADAGTARSRTPTVLASAPPSADDHEDLDDRTQIYTATDTYDLYGSDELHCLELVGDETVEQRFIVGPLGLKIGRTAPADAVLADPKVSRSHCKVELKDGELYVSDLNSTNGTFVDGERIEEQTVIPISSSLTIGRFNLVHEVRTREEALLPPE